MIDIQLLRNSIDAVAARLRARGYELDVHAFEKLEKHRKDIQTTTEQLQAQRNAISKKVGQAKAKKDEALAASLLAQAPAQPAPAGQTPTFRVQIDAVTMDVVAQIHAHLVAHQYEGLIKKANLRGRRE